MTDEAAYRQYLAGDEQAAALLVDRYGDALTLYVNGYVKDLHEAEDLMIEAFARLFARERPIRGESGFKAYLYRTARNCALRHCQKRRFRLLHRDETVFEPQSDAVDVPMLLIERNRQLYQALEGLKPEYREALYLVYFENMSYRSAAAVMDRSEQQITNLVHRGKLRLKDSLEQEGFVYDL